MYKKVFMSVLLISVMCSASFAASPVPPAKGQWALPLEEYILLYNKASMGASNKEIEVPQQWISAPSATRDSNNYLWYSVNINGQKGWIPQNGVRLKMGGKSKIASNLYKSYVKTRNRLINKPGAWSENDEEDDSISYTSERGEFRFRRIGRTIEDIYFQSDDPATVKAFFGTDLIRLYQGELRKKLGTPTTRESPYDDIDLSILCYELSDRNMTLVVTLRRDEGDDEGRVEMVELYAGRAGEPEY